MLEKVAIYLDPLFRKRITNKNEMKQLFSKRLVKRYLRPYLFLKVRKTIDYVYNNSQFYHELFKDSNIKPSDIKTYEDISKIPFTTSSNVLNAEQFFCVPKSKFVQTFKSSGTTGKQKVTHLTKNDVQEQISRNETGFKVIYGINKNDTVRILYGPGYAVFLCGYNALKEIGAKAIYLTKRLPPEQEFQLLKEKNISAIIGDPSFFYSVSSEMNLKYDLRNLGVKTIVLGGEPLPEVSRGKLEKMWGADVFRVYGMNEIGISIAGECEEKNGMHVTENDFYVEVIDPETGQVLEDGEKGELVFTNLSREGMPLVRYRTNDFGFIVPGSCPCGFPFKRIKIEARMDDMILIGLAENLYPIELNEAIFSVPSVTEYQIIFNRENGRDFLKIIIESTQIEKSKKISELVMNAIMHIGQINRGVNVSRTIEISEIKVVKPNTIDRKGPKTKRIIDNRNIHEDM